VTTTILARSVFGRIHVKGHADTADRWRALVKTHGRSDVYVVDNKLPPGATTGWHSHPGPSLILVVAGSVTNYPAGDRRCRPQVYTAGAGFIDAGGGDVHMLRNESDAAAQGRRPEDRRPPLPATAPPEGPGHSPNRPGIGSHPPGTAPGADSPQHDRDVWSRGLS